MGERERRLQIQCRVFSPRSTQESCLNPSWEARESHPEKSMFKPRSEEQIRVRQTVVGGYTSGSLHSMCKDPKTRKPGSFGEFYQSLLSLEEGVKQVLWEVRAWRSDQEPIMNSFIWLRAEGLGDPWKGFVRKVTRPDLYFRKTEGGWGEKQCREWIEYEINLESRRQFKGYCNNAIVEDGMY